MPVDTPPTVLELADHSIAASSRAATLRQRGFAIDRLEDPALALEVLRSSQHSAVILHRSPFDGISLGRALRDIRPELGIVLLGSEWDPGERRKLIEEFADECWTESMATDDLVAWLIALDRRASAAVPCCQLHWRSLRVDFMGGVVVIDGVDVPLQPLQMRILACLIHHSGSVVTTEQIQRLVFRATHMAKTSIPRQISVLRRQLGRFGAEIRTVPGGYGLGLSG